MAGGRPTHNKAFRFKGRKALKDKNRGGMASPSGQTANISPVANIKSADFLNAFQKDPSSDPNLIEKFIDNTNRMINHG